MSEVPGSGVSERWIEWRRTVDLVKYDQRWDAMAARGDSIHGEADFVERLMGERKVRLLDAGCGTGRLAIEMVKRGHHAVGVDLDPDMIELAATKAPHVNWHVADLSKLSLGDKFDVIVMAGNIPLFCAPSSQAAIIKSLADHVDHDGYLISGFSLESRSDAYLRVNYQRDALAAGLTEVAVYSTWDENPSGDTDDYTVMLYQKN
jgi:2-polyprenyl-3-methyl-5-hydroxy-6-metoxy-1,4-benzoquinol methylase